jgi:hypothetical protein
MGTNDFLHYVSQKSTNQLCDTTSRVGGWERAISDATERQEDLGREADTDGSSTKTTSPSPGTLELLGGVTAPYEKVPNAATLRRHLIQVNGSTSVLDDDKPKNAASLPLVDHPNAQILALSTEFRARIGIGWLERTTRALAGAHHVQIYQLIPSLVYKLEFPRT